MKKKQQDGDILKYLRKTMRIMRLSLFLIVISTAMAFSANSYSQNTKLTLDLNNATVMEVIKAIENQSEFLFFYQEKHVDLNRQVTLHATEQDVETILNQLFAGTDNIYVINDRQIVLGIAPRKELERQMLSLKGNVKPVIDQPQQKEVAGTVTDTDGLPLPGVSVIVKGTTIGTVTNADGEFSLSIPLNAEVLQFSFVGMRTQEIPIDGRTTFTVVMEQETVGMDEIVVVGYGTQKKSDITGTVASLQQDRLELTPNLNIAQAIQGAIPGVMMQTTSAGAVSSESIMIRGRNSITANNSPLLILDGMPYAGELGDLNPNDVKSIEVLKDASAAAIYGSRGANGVILITSKMGLTGEPKISYDGYYSMQRFTELPDLMDGGEFWDFKMIRAPDEITQSEREVYESGEWVDWLDLALRNGKSTEHNISVSGGFNDTKFYISGGVVDVQGLAVNDDYLRITSRVNLDTKITNWLTIGTRNQFSYDDKSGIAPTWDTDHGVFWFNPLTTAYDADGNLTIYPWREDPYFRNPLMGTLAEDMDESYQILSNNYAIVDFPFIPGLQYKFNAGIRFRFHDQATYYGRDTQTGLVNRGRGNTNRIRFNDNVIENILNYNKSVGKHNIFLTGLYSFEENKSSGNGLGMIGFPYDFLTWYAAGQAELLTPDYTYNSTRLISQMARANYSFDSRYLLTLTVRRDGYSGFGAKTKWGVFPSMAVGWNISNENFFTLNDVINQLKLRASYGVNGNQAVGAYESISRLEQRDHITGTSTLPGNFPIKLGADNLGWESTASLNVGLDFGLLSNRITGDINLYKSTTNDLLLDRTISPIHGITSITQNIGEVENRGFELSVTSRNIAMKDFSWITTGNISFIKNKIVSLYGEIGEEGNEIDDLANNWFIGQPIRVIYDYVWDGVWQLDEADEAAVFGSEPGFVKLKDISGPDGAPDGVMSAAYDKAIIGQQDPKFNWGMSNSLKYKDLTLSIFMYGVHGMTKQNTLLDDEVDEGVRMTTTEKNWWTPDNPTNEWVKNHLYAQRQAGIDAVVYEKAGFVRIKDITLAYDFSNNVFQGMGFDKLKLYFTGRNLFTFTNFGGMDPELTEQRNIPLQKEYVIGINLGF